MLILTICRVFWKTQVVIEVLLKATKTIFTNMFTQETERIYMYINMYVYSSVITEENLS